MLQQPVQLFYSSTPSSYSFQYTSSNPMTLLIPCILLLLSLLSTAYSQPVSQPEARCLTGAARHIFPNDSLTIIASLNFSPIGEELRPWGAEGSSATKFTQTVAEIGDCELLLQKTDAWQSLPPSFALADYDDQLLSVYYECVESGTRRGGKVRIGPRGGRLRLRFGLEGWIGGVEWDCTWCY